MRIWDHRVTLQQWCKTSELVVVSTWRQAGSFSLFAIFSCVFQRGALCDQWSTGAVELEWVVVGCWIKGQSVESWKTQTQKSLIKVEEVRALGETAMKHEKQHGVAVQLCFLFPKPEGHYLDTHHWRLHEYFHFHDANDNGIGGPIKAKILKSKSKKKSNYVILFH